MFAFAQGLLEGLPRWCWLFVVSRFDFVLYPFASNQSWKWTRPFGTTIAGHATDVKDALGTSLGSAQGQCGNGAMDVFEGEPK